MCGSECRVLAAVFRGCAPGDDGCGWPVIHAADLEMLISWAGPMGWWRVQLRRSTPSRSPVVLQPLSMEDRFVMSLPKLILITPPCGRCCVGSVGRTWGPSQNSRRALGSASGRTELVIGFMAKPVAYPEVYTVGDFRLTAYNAKSRAGARLGDVNAGLGQQRWETWLLPLRANCSLTRRGSGSPTRTGPPRTRILGRGPNWQLPSTSTSRLWRAENPHRTRDHPSRLRGAYRCQRRHSGTQDPR